MARLTGVGAATVLSLAALGACTSSDDTSTTPAATEATTASPTDTTGVIGPIVVEPGTTTLAATVGRALDIAVEGDPGAWEIASDNVGVLTVSQGGEKDGATFNPGAQAVMAGMANLTLTNTADDTTWQIAVTVS
ncbi:MAG: hypothetical protein ACOYEV_05745 [Candidatus Nanopelagicales bacterium]